MELKPGYKQTDVGVIPEEWSVRRLGEIGESLIGLTYSPENVKSDGLLVLRSSNVAEGELRFEDNVFVDVDVPERIILRKDDILICVRNGSRGLIGKCAKIDERAEGMTFGAFMAVFRTDFHNLVYHQFQSEILKRQIHEHLGATINQITNASLHSFRIPFPRNEAEQRAIAGALSDVDALIGALNQLIAKKCNLKQAAMQQFLTGQTRLPGFRGEWGLRTVAEIAEVSKGTQLHGSETNSYGSFPHFNGGISPSSYTNKSNAPANTIIISEGGNSCGYVQLVPESFWCGGHCYTVMPKNIDNRFLYHALKTQQAAIMGLRVGSGLPNIQKTALAAFKLRIPSEHAEQTRVAEVLSDMDAELAALEQRLTKTRTLKQGMMQELLTGRIRLV